MKLGVSIVPLRLEEDLKIIETLLNLGIRFISLSDYHKAGDPFILLSESCKMFKSIRIGIGITNFLVRDKEYVLKLILELSKGSSNEIFLGIGPGDWQLQSKLGIFPREALSKLKEALLFFKRNLKDTDIKIYVGAQGVYTMKLAKYADGIMLNLANLEDLSIALKKIEEFGLSKKEKMAIAQLYLGPDSLKNARKSAAIIYAGFSNSSLYLYGYEKSKRDELRSLMLEGRFEEARNIIDEDEAKRLTIAGSIEEIKDKLNKIFMLNLDAFILGLPMGKERFETLRFLPLLLNELKSEK